MTVCVGHRRVAYRWIIGHEVCGTVRRLGSVWQGPWQVGDALAVAALAYRGMCDVCLDEQHKLCRGHQGIAQAWPGGFGPHTG